MPPIRVKYSSKAKLYEREFNCEFRVTLKDELFCILCMSNVTCEKRQQVERHRATMKHASARGAIEDKNNKVTLTQQLLPVVSKDFMAELVKTFLAADIPLHKLRNPHVIQLYENLSENGFRNCVQRSCQDSSKQRTRPFEVPTERQVYIHCHR